MSEIKPRLIDLYLSVKVRKSDDIDKLTEADINKEREKLSKISCKDLISYIYNSIDILVELKAQEKFDEKMKEEQEKNTINALSIINEGDENGLKLYEGLLIKAEKDVRDHIRTEQELKLRIEELEMQIDEIERNNQQKEHSFYTKINYLNKQPTKKYHSKKKNLQQYEIIQKNTNSVRNNKEFKDIKDNHKDITRTNGFKGFSSNNNRNSHYINNNNNNINNNNNKNSTIQNNHNSVSNITKSMQKEKKIEKNSSEEIFNNYQINQKEKIGNNSMCNNKYNSNGIINNNNNHKIIKLTNNKNNNSYNNNLNKQSKNKSMYDNSFGNSISSKKEVSEKKVLNRNIVNNKLGKINCSSEAKFESSKLVKTKQKIICNHINNNINNLHNNIINNNIKAKVLSDSINININQSYYNAKDSYSKNQKNSKYLTSCSSGNTPKITIHSNSKDKVNSSSKYLSYSHTKKIIPRKGGLIVNSRTTSRMKNRSLYEKINNINRTNTTCNYDKRNGSVIVNKKCHFLEGEDNNNKLSNNITINSIHNNHLNSYNSYHKKKLVKINTMDMKKSSFPSKKNMSKNNIFANSSKNFKCGLQKHGNLKQSFIINNFNKYNYINVFTSSLNPNANMNNTYLGGITEIKNETSRTKNIKKNNTNSKKN